ncbi:TCR/Tet family MFS transporter [Hymenobacter swuensis]|uniref:Tetracycline resistance protein n=1 Tax=Hymenobacter swuensis DY53 TaxID=1227739 RepID=W8EZM3_9BACT|nr:TCR/Tet family MFS transporter [Hymenobacter swuensis]AHJ98088.1 tetracycline resistance protein [Hymenobacter swuensis DY53]
MSASSSPRKAALGFIFFTLLLDVTGIGIIIPVIPTLIRHLTGGTISDAARIGGWLVFAFAIMQFLFSPVMGNLSDRFGRRPVLLLSLLGFALDYVLLAFAPTIGWLFVGRLIAGVMGASFTTASAYIADISTPETRAQNFGMIGAAFGLGFIIGPLLGSQLVNFGPKVPFLAAAALTLLNLLYGFFVLPESLPQERRRAFDWRRANPVGSLKMLKRYPVITGLVSSLLCIYIAAHATQSNWTYYVIEKFDWSNNEVGYSLAAIGLLVAIVQGLLIRRINPALGPKRSVFLGMLLYAVGFVLFAFATKGWMMYVFLVPYCLAGISGPALQGIISGQVPGNEQGELQGALTSLMSLTSIVGPPLMTNLFSYFTGPKAPIYFPGAPFLLGTVLILISLLLAVRSLATYVVPLQSPETAEPEPVIGH